MLFSALRCLLIELNTGLLCNSVQVPASQLANSPNDIETILKYYDIDDCLAEDLRSLVEIRHEVIHPSHRPTGTPDKMPVHFGRLRELKLLQVCEPDGYYNWPSQLQSHRLFEWAFATIKHTVVVLLKAHNVDDERADGIAISYSSSMS